MKIYRQICVIVGLLGVFNSPPPAFAVTEMKVSANMSEAQTPTPLSIGTELIVARNGKEETWKAVAVNGEKLSWESTNGCSWGKSSETIYYAPELRYWAARLRRGNDKTDFELVTIRK